MSCGLLMNENHIRIHLHLHHKMPNVQDAFIIDWMKLIYTYMDKADACIYMIKYIYDRV